MDLFIYLFFVRAFHSTWDRIYIQSTLQYDLLLILQLYAKLPIGWICAQYFYLLIYLYYGHKKEKKESSKISLAYNIPLGG